MFVEQDKRFSWNELAEAVDALAAGLLALGMNKGDRIGIWSPNRWEWLVTQFATARIGLCWSTSIRPTASPSSNTRSTRSAAAR